MTVNSDKFQAKIIDKNKRYHSNEALEINNETVEAAWAVKRLGGTSDGNLNFNLYISKICRSAAH